MIVRASSLSSMTTTWMPDSSARLFFDDMAQAYFYGPPIALSRRKGIPYTIGAIPNPRAISLD